MNNKNRNSRPTNTRNRNKIPKRNPRRRKKGIDLLTIVTIFSSIVFVFLVYRYINQQAEINQLRQQSSNLLSISNNLQEEINDLNKEIENANSLEYIEKMAREKLGMIKKDEKIYLTPEQIESLQENNEGSENREEPEDNTEQETNEESQNEEN